MDTFNSKIDLWLAVVFLASIAVMVYVAIITPGLVIVLALGASSILMVWVLLVTKYSVDDRELRVTSGPFRWIIPVSDVQSVRPSNNLLSSPALSLDRLELSMRGRKFCSFPLRTRLDSLSLCGLMARPLPIFDQLPGERR